MTGVVAMTGTGNLEGLDTTTMPPLTSLVVLGTRMYNEEYVRLASYNSMTPLDGCHPVLMARAGLYYTGPSDAIQCYSCNTILTNWRSQCIDPVKLHRQTAPECSHSRGEDSTNVPITAPDAAATTTIKDMLRQRCAELDLNPTQVYYDLCRTFREIGGVSRGEMFAAGPGDIVESSGPAALGPAPVAMPDAFGMGGGALVDVSDGLVDRARLGTNSPGIDFELCKASVHERLKTFEHWPTAAQVHPTHLAEAGFVYTGPQDRVQCVHCEGSLRNWQTGDVPSEEHARHFPTCPMILRAGQAASATPSVAGEAGSGSNLLPFAERSRNTPPPIAGAGGGTSEATPPVPRRDLLGIVTERPKHPNMAIEATRIGSFTNWPTGKKQTPQLLAKAGFFYAGFNDSVKCFFCDGGLRNWEREDDPWHEHARWFPRCKYVRQVMGEQFVDRVLAEEHSRVQQTATYEAATDMGCENPPAGMGDPHLPPGETTRRRSRSGSSGRGEGRERGGGERGAPPSHPPLVEAREVMARMDTLVVRAVLNMDIPQDLVRRAIEHRLRNTGDDFPSMEALLETVFELSASHQNSAARHAGSGEPSPINTGSPVRRPASGEPPHAAEGAPRSLLEENRQLKEQRTCKICMDEEVCVVFVPCGHLVCCATCAPPLSKCPICRSTIRGTVRTYMS